MHVYTERRLIEPRLIGARLNGSRLFGMDYIDVPRGPIFLCVLIIHLISPAFLNWGFGMVNLPYCSWWFDCWAFDGIPIIAQLPES